MKTSDLTGPTLAWAVAKALNHPAGRLPPLVARHGDELWYHISPAGHEVYRPQEWEEGGPLLESEGISVVRLNDLYFPKGNEHGRHWEEYYRAMTQVVTQYGPTMLIAAMRCLVASRLGLDITIPKELQ